MNCETFGHRAQTFGTDRRRSKTLTDGGASVSVSGTEYSAQGILVLRSLGEGGEHRAHLSSEALVKEESSR
ncbi:MAG: hypothetical protein HPY62_08935 [Bacteroidales bacterium]|nr:hypothetical protein [Bacteroidales bacterium]